MKAFLISLPVLASLVCFLAPSSRGSAAAESSDGGPVWLSPSALAVSPEGRTLYIACATANQILFLDVGRGQIVRRVQLPAPPSGLALSTDGSRLYVTCAAPESTVCIFATSSGKQFTSIPAGHTAMAPVLCPNEKTLYVCNRFNDEVSVIDLARRKESCRIAVEREPVAAAVTPDGSLLFVVNHIHTGPADVGVVAASVSVIDTTTQKVKKHIPLTNGSTLLRGICASPDGRYMAVTHTLARFHLPTTHVEHGWMNDNALTLIDTQELKVLNTVLLDDVDRGAANPWAVAWTSDGNFLCVTHAGTHELSVIDAPALLAKLTSLPMQLETSPSRGYSASRIISDVPNDLAFLVGMRTRVKLPGNGPRALALSQNGAFVANYFSDSLCVLDLPASRRMSPSSVETKARVAPEPELHTISLGSADTPVSTARKGEMYFNDATLCLQGWQSCASCHSSDARVDGMDWDLLNDGIGNPKNVKSLLLSFQTPPVMSLGVRADAAAAIRAGIRHILFAVPPDDVAASLDEYVKNLQPIPSPYLSRGRLSAAAQRGKTLFFDRTVGCANCHKEPFYTDLKPHRVGTGKFDQQTDEFYTPTLIEVWRTAPYLHDGSAPSVREAITTHNPLDRRGKTSQLKREQVDDLVSFVLSL